jgi:dienelactone hydrolase
LIPDKYEEWKIEYDVETSETMPVEAGRRVPAYLLIPGDQHSRPLPAMICFHQCAIDCVTGKEAVVGKAPSSPASVTMSEVLRISERVFVDRIDQAYGLELVHQGFVVLAPDSINCGERNIEAIRQVGQNRVCWHIIDPHLGKEAQFKRIFDGMRAVDLLQSLDFVDSGKIGAIGHSMGASDVYWLMVFDDRVKAGILSGIGYDKPSARFLPLISPRLYVGLRGMFDGSPEDLRTLHEMHENARPFYESDGAPENFILVTAKAGHRFVDEFKWKAYKLLKEYFGVLPARETISLPDIVREAREAVKWFWTENKHEFPEPRVQKGCSVLVDREQMVSAFAGLFLHLFTKDSKVELRVTVTEDADAWVLDCRIPCDSAAESDSQGATWETFRGVQQILAEHDASLRREYSDHEIRYLVSFPKAS